MSEMEEKVDHLLHEVRQIKTVMKTQVEILEDIKNLFSKYDTELLLEDEELRNAAHG